MEQYNYPINCPFCETDLENFDACPKCGAYKVTEENYDVSPSKFRRKSYSKNKEKDLISQLNKSQGIVAG